MPVTKSKDLWSGTPVWYSYPVPRLPVERLARDIKADVAVIGTGISGAMAAEELAAHGYSVVMLDRRAPLHGSTAAATALLQYEIDTPLVRLSRRIGEDSAVRAWRRSRQALENIAAKIAALKIKCDEERPPALYLPGNILDAKGLKSEAEARVAAGLYTRYLTRAEIRDRFNIKKSGALYTAANIAINPLQLTAGFLKQAARNGAKILSPVTVSGVDANRNGVHIQTEEGPVVSAKHAVFATGHEVLKCIDIRSFGVSINSSWAFATKPQPSRIWPERANVWECAAPYLYIRTTRDGRVVCGGEDEKFADETERDSRIPDKVAALERKLGKIFPHIDTKAEYAWAGCFGETKTSLPLIGAIPGMNNCYAVMAFGGNGFTFSRIGAEIILALLQGKEDPEADIFRLKKS
jgi:glycine/D-amino acid oxidase-like deaminating enzyme